MATLIKCSYEDCSQEFATLKAMQKHKAKDQIHEFYCKRCDEDCTDDTGFFYHQITSLRHACCPICGREFKSESGRDRHVELDHPAKQKLNCVGCNNTFNSASSLMHHIENDECPVIKRAHFYNQRAERQIAMESWQNATAQYTVSGNSSTGLSDAQSKVKSSLLDADDDDEDDPAGPWADSNRQGVSVQEAGNAPLRSERGYLPSEFSSLSIDQFPSLNAATSEMSNTRSNSDHQRGDLLDVNQEPKVSTKRNIDTTSSILLPQVSTISNDPASGHNRIITSARIAVPSHLEMEQYYDTLSENYMCPGSKCKARCKTLEHFRDHLLSPAHNPGQVRCPGCLRQFRTTTALIAHCESASRKCKIRDSYDYDMVIKQITAGIIAADGYQEDGSIKYTAQKIEDW